jgi:replicative DNA helicase
MDVVEAASAPITAIHDALTASRPPLSTKTIIAECIEAYQGRLKGTHSPMGIPTISEIDVYLRGLHPGRVVIIGAPSGGGKSVLGSQIILEASLAGHPCMEINYEMRESDSMNRKIIQVSRVPSQAFMDPINYGIENDTPPTNKGFLQALQRSVAALTAAPIRLVRPSNRQLRTLLAVIRKGVREHGVKVVSIDYLQLIRCKAGSSEGEISEISHSIQELAQELGISILLLSQLNANGDTKHGVVAIEDCDAYLVIQQETDKQAENYGQHYDILLSKDRHNGNQGKSIPLIFDANIVRFVQGFVSRKKAPAGPKKKPGF